VKVILSLNLKKVFLNLLAQKYSIAVTNGTSALEIAFRAIDIKNQEVVVPTNTFFATIIAIIKPRHTSFV